MIETEAAPVTSGTSTKPLTTDLLRVLGPSYFTGPAYFGDISFPSGMGVPRVFNVQDERFGAKGDGTTDDTLAIQAAISAAEAAYGGSVFFPTGTYIITDQLRVKRTLSLISLSGTVLADSDYTTDAGWPVDTGGVIIKQTTAGKRGLFIQQETTGVYSIIVRIENIMFLGPVTGATANGIEVDAGAVGFPAVCIFKNVNVSYFTGYGISLTEGYFGSYFENINVGANGLTGFRTVGTHQGEWAMVNLRSFGNGLLGATEVDQAGLYVKSGGGGVSLNRISCTYNYRVNAMIEGTGFQMFDYWTESFPSNNAACRSLVVKGCTPRVYGCGLAPQNGFLGKMIDLRSSAVNGSITGILFFGTSDATGFQIYEDGTSGSNVFQVAGLNGTLYTNLSTDSVYETGNAVTQTIFTNIASSPSMKLTAATPATTTRTVNIPDPGANADIVLTKAAQTISGVKTFDGQLIGKGTATNDDAAAAYIGEVVRSNVVGGSAVSSTGTNEWFDVTSISLTAGDWVIDGVLTFIPNGSILTNNSIGISSTSGNFSTGLVNGDNQIEVLPATTAASSSALVSGFRVSLSGTTTYYLKGNMTFTVATPKAFGRISARRTR